MHPHISLYSPLEIQILLLFPGPKHIGTAKELGVTNVIKKRATPNRNYGNCKTKAIPAPTTNFLMPIERYG